MIHSIYKCEDYEIHDKILFIWDAEEVAKVKDLDGYSDFLENTGGRYNAIICPGLYKDTEDFDSIRFIKTS